MLEFTETWAVVLAGGEGNRLREVTIDESGEVVPKQFCSFKSSRSLLEEAIRRGEAVADPERVGIVVAAHHRRFWAGVLATRLAENIWKQPKNCGTAYGILLALLQLERHVDNPVVAFLPADHYVTDERSLANGLRVATTLASQNTDEIFILGVEPEYADSELGYLVPRQTDRSPFEVARFVEKPSKEDAEGLIAQGAVWNAFIFVGRLRALLSLFGPEFSGAIEAMRDALGSSGHGDLPAAALDEMYQNLEHRDFSREVLAPNAHRLRALRVAKCGWTDLGTPERVEEAARRTTDGASSLLRVPVSRPQFLDLTCGSALCLRPFG